jgi:hypothetical protein
MLQITKQHAKHLSKKSNIPSSSIRIAAKYALEGGTQAQAIADIRSGNHRRGGKMTFNKASERFCIALSVAREAKSDLLRGEKRREKRAGVTQGSTEDRLNRAVNSLFPHRGFGGDYSGTTTRTITYGEPSVDTTQTCGDRYGGSSKYFQTNATHSISCTVSGLRSVIESGLPIWLGADNAYLIQAAKTRPGIFKVLAVVAVGKQIRLRKMFIAQQEGGFFHLAKTERGAVTALNRSNQAPENERGNINSSILRKWGWCREGTLNWCASHGITRNINARLRRGAKPLAIARLILRHGGPINSYEKRLIRQSEYS